MLSPQVENKQLRITLPIAFKLLAPVALFMKTSCVYLHLEWDSLFASDHKIVFTISWPIFLVLTIYAYAIMMNGKAYNLLEVRGKIFGK